MLDGWNCLCLCSFFVIAKWWKWMKWSEWCAVVSDPVIDGRTHANRRINNTLTILKFIIYLKTYPYLLNIPSQVRFPLLTNTTWRLILWLCVVLDSSATWWRCGIWRNPASPRRSLQIRTCSIGCKGNESSDDGKCESLSLSLISLQRIKRD